MNLLTDVLPTAFLIDDVTYPINTDYATGLKIMGVFEDKELTIDEQLRLMLELLFCGELPENTTKALELANKFLNCGEENPENQEEPAPNLLGRLFSFTQDANYIFTAINQTHGIDVERHRDMHWWKFCALFQDVSEDCLFSRLIYLRKQKKTGKMTKEEREWYSSIKEIADLENDDILANDENANEFMELLGQS